MKKFVKKNKDHTLYTPNGGSKKIDLVPTEIITPAKSAKELPEVEVLKLVKENKEIFSELEKISVSLPFMENSKVKELYGDFYKTGAKFTSSQLSKNDPMLRYLSLLKKSDKPSISTENVTETKSKKKFRGK